MRLAGISTMEEGNKFLPNFIVKFNNKFGKKLKSSINVHRPIDNHNLDRILICIFRKINYERLNGLF